MDCIEHEEPQYVSSEEEKEMAKKTLHGELVMRVNELLQDRREANFAFDKSLQLVSSGAIVISFTYLLQLKTPLTLTSLILLILSWLLFGFAIGISLFGQHKSCKLYDDAVLKENLIYAYRVAEIEPHEEKILEGLIKSTEEDENKVKCYNLYQLRITAAGIVVFGLFVIFTTLYARYCS